MINSLGSRLGAVSDQAIGQAFKRDAMGRVSSLEGVAPNLPGGPTIKDIAARLPRFESSLTPDQLRVMHQLESEVAPYRELLEQVGVPIISRRDVMEGGSTFPEGGLVKRGWISR